MNKAMDRSIRVNPIVALTSGIRKSQSDKPSDCVTKNSLRAITGFSWNKDLNNKIIFYSTVVHLKFLTLKLNRLSKIL